MCLLKNCCVKNVVLHTVQSILISYLSIVGKSANVVWMPMHLYVCYTMLDVGCVLDNCLFCIF
jgi:hypothetical protein